MLYFIMMEQKIQLKVKVFVCAPHEVGTDRLVLFKYKTKKTEHLKVMN